MFPPVSNLKKGVGTYCLISFSGSRIAIGTEKQQPTPIRQYLKPYRNI